MKYVLGIDQGGTKTCAIVADSKGNVLGMGKSGGAYHISDGIKRSMETIKDASSKALEKANISLKDIAAVGAGITGMDWPEDYELLKSSLIKLLETKNIYVKNDCLSAFYGGTFDSYGAVLCAGTGLNAAVISPTGEEFVLGFYISDNVQGGSALAQRSLRKVFDSDLGLCGPTKLTEAFLKYAGVDSVMKLMHKYYSDETFANGIRGIVPVIVEIANNKDSEALKVIKEFAGDMSKYIYAGLKKLDMLNSDCDVVLSGSVLKGNDNILTQMIKENIKAFAPHTNVVNSKFEPVVGSAIIALSKLDTYLSDKEQIKENLSKTAEEFSLIRKKCY